MLTLFASRRAAPAGSSLSLSLTAIEDVTNPPVSNEATFPASLGVQDVRCAGRSGPRKVTMKIFRRIAQLCDLSGGRKLTKLTGFGLEAFHFVSFASFAPKPGREGCARSTAPRRRAEDPECDRAAPNR